MPGILSGGGSNAFSPALETGVEEPALRFSLSAKRETLRLSKGKPNGILCLVLPLFLTVCLTRVLSADR